MDILLPYTSVLAGSDLATGCAAAGGGPGGTTSPDDLGNGLCDDGKRMYTMKLAKHEHSTAVNLPQIRWNFFTKERVVTLDRARCTPEKIKCV